MKKGIVLIMIAMLSLPILNAQKSHAKDNCAGTWKFEAPYAPEGYTSGTIVVSPAEQKHTTTMSFTGNDFKFPGENISAERDSIQFSVFIQGENVKVILRVENDTLMSGKAIYSEGEVPLSLKRSAAGDAIVKQ
jgi:hypothetical protein